MNKVVLMLGLCVWGCTSWAAARGDEPVASDAPILKVVVQAEQERIQAIDKAVQSAVAIFSADGNGGGSGVVISPDGYAVTNYHVVQPVGEYMQCGMVDGRLYDAVLVNIDPTGDVALIKLFGRDDFPVAEMADSDDVRVGDWCFAVGNPFLLATNFQPSVSYGIVSGVHRYQFPAGTLLEYTDCIQTDAAINPGNSGGPLFNAAGQLIGINGRGSFEKRGRVNVGLGYAISINQVRHFLGHLHSGRIVDHATLGATVSDDEAGRVLVSNILSSSDAYRRGLRYGDEIVAFGGRAISSSNAFKNVLGIYPKGWRVPLSYRRDGVRYDVQVRLAGVHSEEELLAKIQQRPPEESPPKNPAPDEEKAPRPEKLPTAPHGAQTPVPEEFARYIQERSGFANYYFNELHRTRVWNAWHDAAGDFAVLRGDWHLSGEGQVSVTLGESTSKIKSGADEIMLRSDQDLAEQLDPPGSGGLLATMHLWRRLLVEGPTGFGDVYYLGKAPLLDHEGLFDVLVGTFDVVEATFYFDPATSLLVAVEMTPDPGDDPCEIHLSDYRDVSGMKVPHRWLIRHGNQVFLDLILREVQLPLAEKSET